MIGIALMEKEGPVGLDEKEILELYHAIKDGSAEVYPIEIPALEHKSSAMGFISAECAEMIGYDYEASGLNSFVAGILDDMDKETKDGIYRFRGITIKLTR